ncbi:hypothetical protein BJX63DRAFT_384536 [Aspergillus granulosus]|uniref:DNA mismatch repair protein S5 domain-containing protein n=1 Tax=Aspergillus granulosus TaxID=176169 RepID=A0ABR4HTL3_9EURO
MPIEALPPATARAIGSTSTISDPCSIVKEVLDNALDAFASSVSIEISQDTVSIIQVKDNGHGIPQGDHNVVCRRGFTSKIQTVEDLMNVGGTSLGFRGEALACAAEISGELAIMTRTEPELVGACLKYGRDGELLSTERVSHPVGTTVRISGLFKHIPVRRRTSIKDAKKTMMKIRKMVQAYAMARPTTKLSFRVIKAKTTSGDWMYAPGGGATFMEAAMQVVGTEVTSMCILVEWPRTTQGEIEAQGSSCCHLAALLPKPGSDFTVINNKGQYISIDGRPMTSGRGISQDIMKLYKSHLRSASLAKNSPTITDPFLYLRFTCPEGIYDVNVEPLKDDVIFEDRTVVLSLVKTLFQETYGGSYSPQTSISALDGQHTTPDRNAIATLLQTAPIESTSSLPIPAASSAKSFVNTPFSRPQLPHHSPPCVRSTAGRESDPVQQSGGMLPLDAMSPTDTSGRQQPSPETRNGVITRIFPHSNQESIPQRARRAFNLGSSLPSPRSNRDTPISNNTSHSPLFNQATVPVTSPTQLSPTTPVRGQTRQRQNESERAPYSNATIDSWFHSVTQTADFSQATQHVPGEDDELPLSVLAQRRFGNGVRPTSASGLSSHESQSPNNSSASESPKAPTPTQAAPPTRGTNRHQGLPVLEQWSAKVYADHNSYQNPELQKALDFEVRKRAAIQERRTQLRTPGPSANPNSPHRNMYIPAIASLNSELQLQVDLAGRNDMTQGTSVPVFSPHDPRAYLKRFLEAQGTDHVHSSRLKRINSTKLPFEKILTGHDLHNVSIKCPAELPFLSTTFMHTIKEDLYIQTGGQAHAFMNPDGHDIEFWASRLTAMIGIQYKAAQNSDTPELQLDFSHLS